MFSWFEYLRNGLTRLPGKDRVADQQSAANTRANLNRLRPFLFRHWRKGLVGVIVVILATLLTYPLPLIYRYLVDDVILAHQMEKLWVGILLFAGIKVLGLGMGAIQQFLFTRFEQSVVLDIQSDLFEHLLHFPKTFFDKTEVGYLMSRIQQDVYGVQWFFSQTLVYALTSILKFIGGIVFLFYLDWRLAIAVLFLLPFLVFTLKFFSKKMRVLSHAQMEQSANVSRNLQESLSSTTLIKSYGSEKHTLRRMKNEWRAAQQLSMEQITVGSLANMVIGALPGLGAAMVFIVGAYLVIQGEWTFGSLIAFQSYLGYVYEPAMALASTNLQLQNALASLARVSGLYNIVPEENQGVGYKVEHLSGEIEFKDVSFSYDGVDMVLENVSFVVKKGEHIAIVGPSGVGKTTLVSLILQFYRPKDGEILFDGMASSKLELGSLRGRIGYVSQSILLMEGSIRENICYGNLNASQEQMDQALQASGIYEFIQKLPDKYESRIGERGVNLSEGQKQRLAIARALIRNPDILVLDEPTSSLDHHLEESIINDLPGFLQGKTLIIIAHHPSTIQKADRILLLREKHLEASGTHKELLISNEYYRSLFV